LKDMDKKRDDRKDPPQDGDHDYHEALKWYFNAAEKGHSVAHHNAAHLHDLGNKRS